METRTRRDFVRSPKASGQRFGARWKSTRVWIPSLLAGLGMIAMSTVPRQLQAHELLIGVNQVNMGYLSRAEQAHMLTQISSAGVRGVRLTLRVPFGPSLEAVRLAQSAGLAVLLTVELHDDEYYPPGTPRRAGREQIFDAYPLSRIDPGAFARRLRENWTALEAQGGRLAGIQLGNEINWAAFNGDLRAVEASAAAFDRAAFNEAPVRRAFEAGLDRYLELARALRVLRDSSDVHRGVPLIASGLADISSRGAAAMQADSVRPEVTLDLLRARGAAELFDGFAQHLYFVPTEAEGGVRARVARSLATCAADGKRCWITEWGVLVPRSECPVDDSVRSSHVRTVARTLAARGNHERIASTFFFQWRDESEFALWRCGGLTEAGRAVIASPARRADE